MNKIKIGFLGYGNMAQAITKGWLQTNKITAEQLYASARNWEKLQKNTTQTKITPLRTNEELVAKADLIVLAVKPHQIDGVLEPLKEHLKNKIIVSVAVNYLNDAFNQLLGEKIQHLSTLPNTPVEIQAGIILFEKTHTLTDDNFAIVKDLFSFLGLVKEIPTDQMDIAGVISGSAPAFVDLFIEALADAGVKHGLDRKIAYQIISQMVSGTGQLQLRTGLHPGELKDQITSPGGTTIKGIAALEKNQFRGAVIDAVDEILNK